MKINWEKWGLDFYQSLGRHVGTAGMTWLGLGVKGGKLDWSDLWVALLAGAILPTVFTFIQQPVPVEEDKSDEFPKPPLNLNPKE